MKNLFLSVVILLVLAVTVPVLGEEPPHPPLSEPHPVELVVGEIFKVCLSGLVICPPSGVLCDDPAVAVPVETPDGVGFKGVGPGTTLCAALPPGARYGSPRALFRITVRPPDAKAPR